MSESKIKRTLINEMKNKVSNGLYYYSQINFAYNSNRIEGSILSEEQTKMLFENCFEQNLIFDDDVIETQNHFKLFDYIIENVDKEITVEMILKMHAILKEDTNEKMYAGKFKTYKNVIGIINSTETVAPDNVLNEKECLKNNIMPFIISDENKMFYLRGLNNYKYDKMFLIDTCKNAQDIYEHVCKILID